MKTSDLFKWIKEINQVSTMILSNQDLAITTDKILDILNTHLNSLFLIYLKIDEENKNLVLHSFSQKHYVKLTERFKFDPYKIIYPLNFRGPLVIECAIQNKILQSKSFKDFFYPIFPWQKVLNTIQWILNVRTSLALPIQKSNAQIMGVLFMATEKDEFTSLELELIQFYANLFKIAFENHQNFNDLKHQFETEKEISSMLAHELKTPVAIALNNIQMATDLLAIKEQTQEEAEIIRKAKEAVQRMNSISDSVLAFREVETQELSIIHEFDLKYRLLPILERYERQCNQKGLQFRYSFKAPKEKIICGGVQFEQILTILLDNAFKYTEKGYIEVKIFCDKNSLQCEVIDTGYGIPENKKQAIFQRFYRARTEKNKGLYGTSGLGLGLYIAKKLVYFLKGEIAVSNNNQDSGTCFSVKIPIYQTIQKQALL